MLETALVPFAGVLGLTAAWIIRWRTRPAAAGAAAAAGGFSLAGYAWREALVVAVLIAAAAAGLWIVLRDWRAGLSMWVGALLNLSALALARHVAATRSRAGAVSTVGDGIVVGLSAGGLWLLGAGCLYLMLGFHPRQYVDFTGFVLGTLVVTGMAKFGGDACGEKLGGASSAVLPAGAMWFQPAAGVAIAVFGFASMLPATATMLIGPQGQLLALPFLLIALAWLGDAAGMFLLAQNADERLALVAASVLFLAGAVVAMAAMDIYWQLWLCLAAGTFGAWALLLVPATGKLARIALPAAVAAGFGLVSWWAMPADARIFGLSLSGLGLLANFSLYICFEESRRLPGPESAPAPREGMRYRRLAFYSGWMVVALLTVVSLRYLQVRFAIASPSWGDWRWITAAAVGPVAVCAATYIGIRGLSIALASHREGAGSCYAAWCASASSIAVMIVVTAVTALVLGPFALGAYMIAGFVTGAALEMLLSGRMIAVKHMAWFGTPEHIVREMNIGTMSLTLALAACTAHLVAQVWQ